MLHHKGQKPSQIGRATGLNRKQVARVLAAEGIRRGPFVSASAVLPKILELRQQGMTVGEIGKLLGYSKGAIGRALKGQKRAKD